MTDVDDCKLQEKKRKYLVLKTSGKQVRKDLVQRVDGGEASSLCFKRGRVRGPPWLPGAAQGLRRQKPHS